MAKKSQKQAGVKVATPFLKWAGGKRWASEKVVEAAPAAIDCYIEAFLGGGASFFALAAAGRLVGDIVLADRNAELVATWQAVRDEPEALIQIASQWPHDEEVYYWIRDTYVPESPVHEAARVCWLNRTCFNGLYRKNRAGHFNVAFGRYVNPRMVDAENIMLCSAALARAVIVCGDFEEVIWNHLADRHRSAMVYLDPPYVPVSETASFNCYDGLAFDDADQRRVGAVAAKLVERGGVQVVAHNSWTPLALDIWGAIPGMDFRPELVRRNISRDADGRGQVPELFAQSAANY